VIGDESLKKATHQSISPDLIKFLASRWQVYRILKMYANSKNKNYVQSTDN